MLFLRELHETRRQLHNAFEGGCDYDPLCCKVLQIALRMADFEQESN